MNIRVLTSILPGHRGTERTETVNASEALRAYIDARCTNDDPETLLKLADQLADAVARER